MMPTLLNHMQIEICHINALNKLVQFTYVAHVTPLI